MLRMVADLVAQSTKPASAMLSPVTRMAGLRRSGILVARSAEVAFNGVSVDAVAQMAAS